ncbi:MAG: resolvase [Cyanobacteria bacterium J06635_1]
MNAETSPPTSAASTNGVVDQHLMPIEAVQKILNRSRASVYRYSNTDVNLVNPPFDPKRLNPERRNHKEEALMFHPNEVARFAQEVLGIQQVTIELTQPAETVTHELLRKVLAELQAIHQLLEAQKK